MQRNVGWGRAQALPNPVQAARRAQALMVAGSWISSAFPGEIPGRSRLNCWGGGAVEAASSGKAGGGPATKVNLFYNGRGQSHYDSPRREVRTAGHHAGGLAIPGSDRQSGDRGDPDGKEHGRAKSDACRTFVTDGPDMSAARGHHLEQQETRTPQAWRKARSLSFPRQGRYPAATDKPHLPGKSDTMD